MTQRRFPWILASVLLAMAALSLPAAYNRGTLPHAHAACDSMPPGGLWLAAYVYLAGISVGAFLVSTFATLFGMERYSPLTRISLFIALVCLLTAHLFLAAHLGDHARALASLLHPASAPVLTSVVSLHAAYGLILAAQLWILMRPAHAGIRARALPDLTAVHRSAAAPRAAPERRLRLLALAGLPIAICCVAGAGLLAAGGARSASPRSGILPVTFILSAPLCGGALVITITALFATGGRAFKSMLLSLGRFLGLLLASQAIVLAAESLLLLTAAPPSQIAVLRTVVAGAHSWLFWVVGIALGTLLPLGLIFLPRKPTLSATAIASLLILLGAFALRANILMREAAQAAPLRPRPVSTPIPTCAEWDFTIFGAGIAGLIFLAGYRLLPLVPRRATGR